MLVAFAAGLSLGAALLARFDARILRPLRVYGLLEVARGRRLRGVAVALRRGHLGVRRGGGDGVVPAGARGRAGGAGGSRGAPADDGDGATLPLVARVAGASVTRLYGANTAGGAVGALGAAYVVLPWLGLAASVRVGACASVGIGLAAIAAERRLGSGREEARDATARATTEETARPTGALVLGAAASGLLVFASEVVFVHLLALVDGTSVYVFGLVLAVFLVALSVGALASRPMHRRLGDGALPASLALSGLALAATIPAWELLPDLFLAVGPYVDAWAAREAVRGLVAALAIGLPAACMGTTFPLVLGALAGRDDRGAQTGRVTAVNTVASVVGSLAGGFALLPALGSQRSLAAIGNGLRGVRARRRRDAPGRGAEAVGRGPQATVAALVVTPRWDLARLSSGANIYFAAQSEQGPVVWMNEDVHGKAS